jgi:hypothetical protein
LVVSGERGIRTPGTVAGTPVFETGDANPEPQTPQQVTETANSVLPSGLPDSVPNDPDLQRVVDAWADLSDHLKREILALVAPNLPGSGYNPLTGEFEDAP